MADILFRKDDWIFSYRVAGIAVCDGKVLLQKPTNENSFAFPGGHVSFGETNEETLLREFKEETGAEISVGELKTPHVVCQNCGYYKGREVVKVEEA